MLLFGLSSSKKSVTLEDGSGRVIELLPFTPDSSAEERMAVEKALKALSKETEEKGKTLVVIDFTLPYAALNNWELYMKLGIPFVMGTTGFDHAKLRTDTEQHAESVYAVIAPNMCKQIVALTHMIQELSRNFPNCFDGYHLSITESHQSTKKDVSGTAKDMLAYFNQLTADGLELEGVEKIRDPTKQMEIGVPEQALKGHAWHTYTLATGSDASDASSVLFQFKHNVCGRRTYAEGVVDAVLFLTKKVAERSDKVVFDMIDVLRAGSMR